MSIKVGIGGDHAGFEYKEAMIKSLKAQGYIVTDYGPNSLDSVDYPDYIHPLANDVSDKKIDLGIAICGSGNGVAMTANKHQDIRAALCWNVELAELARQHNNANIICLPARFIDLDLAISCAETFLRTEFEGGRHQRRVDKIPC